jgi:hypothetical protein
MIIVFAVALSLAGAYLNRFFTEGLELTRFGGHLST